MAPLIPEGYVNPDLLLFFAFVVGLGFGYILEQAGFSSSKKLAGLFYGYDFVVLKVFFTAGVTAMTGLMFLSYMGWIDMSLVYINPTFLWSAIVGGLIMGAGFIMGGFCPGTSLVGAIIGKIDAMVFIAGIFLGIFAFGHFYNLFEPIYTGHFLGHIQIFDTIGISKGWFALILGVVAMVAFAVTQMIEDKVNSTPPSQIAARPSYRLPAMLLTSLLAIYIFLPSERSSSLAENHPKRLSMEWTENRHLVSAEKATFDIMRGNDNVVFIDLRDQEQYRRFTLPGAINIPPENILDRTYRSFFREDKRDKVFFGNGSSLSTKAWITARRAGYDNVYLLDGGLNRMFDMIFIDNDTLSVDSPRLYNFSSRFAKKARRFFTEGEANDAETERRVPVHTIIEVTTPAAQGGC